MKKLIFTAFLVTSFCYSSSIYGQTTYLHCGKLIDGMSNKVQTEVTVILEGSDIEKIEKGYQEAPAGTRLIDLTNYTVMPGLIDMHVHLEGQSSPDNYIKQFVLNDADIAYNSTVYAKATLMAGFTTVRDVGGTGVNISLRDAVNTGKVIGPRILTSGKSLATTGGHADPTNGWREELMGNPGPKEGVLNGPFEARQAVRQRYKEGADLIKITATGGVLSLAKSGTAPQFKMDELTALIETAEDIGFHVAAHAHGVEGMQRAIKAGVKTIEHGTLMDAETMELMKRHGTYLVPTITAGKSVADSAEIPRYYPEVVVPKAKAIGPEIQNMFSRAYKNGVNIAFGTDAGVFKHGKNAKEFSYMVEAGMPPMEAIQSATSIAAKVLGMESEIGSLEAGKNADIIAVAGNPLDDISVMEKVGFVMKNGKIYKSDN